MKCKRGFTFIEIMIVLIIVAILMAIMLPKMKGTLQAARMKESARDVAGVMRIARDFAVLRELPMQVLFDPDKDTYQIQMLDADYEVIKDDEQHHTYHKTNETKLTLGDDASGVRKLPSAVHFQAVYTAAPLSDVKDLPRVIFYADGAASPATVVLQDDNRHAMSIELYRTTGMTQVSLTAPEKEPENERRYYGPESDKYDAGANSQTPQPQ